MRRVFYLDASAWAKRYLLEEGSFAMLPLFEREYLVAGNLLGYVEVVSAIFRKTDGNVAEWLLALLEEDWGKMSQLVITDEILRLAIESARSHRLRGADSIHLAAAINLQLESEPNTEVLVVTSDVELAEAAVAIGLRVMNPAQGP